jgi:uncharacterized membrane protein YphA (DoxX/SURF4 family)
MIVSSVLLWAGLEKLRGITAFGRTLAALRLPGPVRQVLVVAVPASEVAVGTGLVVTPTAAWPLVGVLVLAAAFATAGLIALRAGTPIRCACFGAGSGGVLGRRQVYAFPIWLAAVAALSTLPDWTSTPRLMPLAVVVIAMGAVRATQTERARRRSRADRFATAEGVFVRTPMFAPKLEGPR